MLASMPSGSPGCIPLLMKTTALFFVLAEAGLKSPSLLMTNRFNFLPQSVLPYSKSFAFFS
jgi:hypothetical protein